MNNIWKGGILLTIILLGIFLVNPFLKNTNSAENTTNLNQESTQNSVQEAPIPLQQLSPPAVRYFSSSSDKVAINVKNQTIYTTNPTTIITYSALDSSSNRVNFADSDRAFVRILGITKLYTQNTEILHPTSNGVKDSTIFSGNITLPEQGTYLVKICLGSSINLNSEGVMVWPFGCFEDDTSVQIKVYKK